MVKGRKSLSPIKVPPHQRVAQEEIMQNLIAEKQLFDEFYKMICDAPKEK